MLDKYLLKASKCENDRQQFFGIEIIFRRNAVKLSGDVNT